MTTKAVLRPARKRLEVVRLLAGAVLEIFFRAWATAAALATAFSDANTMGGKLRDGLAAYPTLTEEYRRTQYVVEHREEVESAIDYLNTQVPPQAELESSIARSQETLDELDAFDAKMAELKDFDWQVWRNFGDIKDAWDAIPDTDNVRQLIEFTGPTVDQAQSLVPTYYGGLLTLTDNFARDERWSTMGAMVLGFVIMTLIGRAIAFAVRRGQPGIITRAFQWLGVHVFPGWYASNVPYALNKPLYAHARAHVQRELVADPHAALDSDSFEELEQYFATRTARNE